MRIQRKLLHVCFIHHDHPAITITTMIDSSLRFYISVYMRGENVFSVVQIPIRIEEFFMMIGVGGHGTCISKGSVRDIREWQRQRVLQLRWPEFLHPDPLPPSFQYLH